jgi:hypothetical protein
MQKALYPADFLQTGAQNSSRGRNRMSNGSCRRDDGRPVREGTRSRPDDTQGDDFQETEIRALVDEANLWQAIEEEELMPRAEMEQVVGKAVMDPEFRKRFLADPEQAALDEGIQLTAAEVGALKTLDMKKFEAIGEDIDKSVAESPWYS